MDIITLKENALEENNSNKRLSIKINLASNSHKNLFHTKNDKIHHILVYPENLIFEVSLG